MYVVKFHPCINSVKWTREGSLSLKRDILYTHTHTIYTSDIFWMWTCMWPRVVKVICSSSPARKSVRWGERI